MVGAWLRFTMVCSVVVGIVLVSVIGGGYSSLNRSRTRIKNAKEILAKACQARLDLLPQLTKGIDEKKNGDLIIELNQIGKSARIALKKFISQKTPLTNSLTSEFETSQENFTKILMRLKKNHVKSYTDNQKEIFIAQDTLFTAKKRYNKEMAYFNTRVSVFPLFMVAQLFGLNKIKYFELSKKSFLPIAKTF